MCRAFPLRTGLFTAGPIVIALAQLLNMAIHGTGIWAAAIATAVMVSFSVLVTSYHLAKFRRHTITDELCIA